MRWIAAIALIVLALLPMVIFAQDTNQSQNESIPLLVIHNNQDSQGSQSAGGSDVEVIQSPWQNDSKICIFMREWIQKGMFLVIWLVFLLGVATISGAAFPEWRNYGSKMILGSIGAMILYIIGMQALKFFMGTSICSLGSF